MTLAGDIEISVGGLAGVRNADIPPQTDCAQRSCGARWSDAALSRDNNFDVIRFLLAVLVVLSHSFGLLVGNDSTDPIWLFTRGQRSAGALAVDGFFVISGYLILQSWTNSRGWRSYLRKRVARIYPGFLVASGFCLLIVGPIATDHSMVIYSCARIAKTMGKAVLLDNIQLSGSFPHNPTYGIDGSMWTIKYEFWCYLFVAAAGMFGFLKCGKIVLGAFAAAVLACVAHDWMHLFWPPPGRFTLITADLNSWPRLLSFFLGGATFYAFRDSLAWSPLWAMISAGAIVAGALLPPILTVVEPIAGTYLVMWLAFAPAGPFHFARYGDFSYGIYLYSFPIQQMLIQRYGAGLGASRLFMMALPLTLLAAIASWYCVERRFLQRAKSASRIVHAPPTGT